MFKKKLKFVESLTVLKYSIIEVESLAGSQIMFYLNKNLKYLMNSSNLIASFCLSLLRQTYFLQYKILMLTQRLQGVTQSIFHSPLEGQAKHVSTGIFLRCPARCYNSS